MKKLKKLFMVTVVSTCILFGGVLIPITSHASDTTRVESRMTYIAGYGTNLSISSTGEATISGWVRGKNGVTSTYVKVTLQRSVSGGWVDVKTWEASSSDLGATVAVTYQLSSRGTYRTIMTCCANTESKDDVSAYKTY